MAEQHREGLEKLRELTRGIDVTMLTTAGGDGRIHSRPMVAQEIDAGGRLWFFTRAATGKSHEIDRHPEVNVAYADSGRQRYVSIAGRARLVRDAAKARELWNPAYRAWFPDGLDDPELALIEVEIESAEYWDSRSSAMVHLLGLAKALVTGERYHAGEQGHIEPDTGPKE